MNNKVPEITPRLNAALVAAAEKVGSGVDLRSLWDGLKVFGGQLRVGATDDEIRPYMYEIPRKKTERSLGTTETVEDDTYARNRLDNILRGNHNLVKPELNYIRDALARVGGYEFISRVSDEEILRGKAHLLFRRLLAESPPLEWKNIDPLNAIRALVFACPESLDIGFDDVSSSTRMLERNDGDWDFPAPSELHLTPGHQFKLSIGRFQSSVKPIVINFSEVSGSHSGTLDARAQLVQHIVSTEGRTGDWRVAKRGNKPLRLSKARGRFGFLVVSGLGDSITQLFPDSGGKGLLTNRDLQTLYEALATMISSGDPPRVGILNYVV